MSRQNLGALIVTAAVVLGLIVAVVIVPMIQPRSVEARNDLDVAAERAARRLNVLERMADQAVFADRNKMTLPADTLKPEAEAIQQAIAKTPDMISGSNDPAATRLGAGQVSGKFKALLADHDKRYMDMSGHKPSDGDRAETIEVPAGESGQVSWIKQLQAKGQDPTAWMNTNLDSAINDLQQSISSVSLDTYRGSDHFRANWALGSLQYQKAMLLTSLAANRRAKADILRAQLSDEYRWYTSALAEVKGLESCLAAVSLVAAPVAPTAPAPKVVAPRDAVKAAVEAAGPTAVAPSDEATTPPAPPADGEPAAGGLLSNVKALLKNAAAAANKPAAPGEQAASPAGEGAAAGGSETSTLKALPATEDPSVLAGKYEQEINEQIAAIEKKIAEQQQVMVEPQQQLQQVNQKLEGLQQQLAALEQAGYSVTNTDSFEVYKKNYSDLTAQIRAAEAAAQALQDGTMAGAQLDPDSGEDLTKAKYTGGQPQAGLTTLNRRLEGLQKTRELLLTARQEMQGMLASLQQQKTGRAKTLEQAQARAKERAAQVSKTYGEFEAEMAAAAASEDTALGICRNVVQSYTTALQAAKKQSSDASTELSLANPAPDKRNERLEQLRDYDSPQAASEHSLFNAYMLMAQIQLQRALSLQASHNLVASIQAAGLETKVADQEKAVQESLDGAIAALSTPDGQSDAMRHAEAYGRLITKEKFVWLAAASRGLVYNALAQALAAKGQTQQAAEAKAKAIEALGEAAKGNENSEILQPYTRLLASLRQEGK